MTLALLADIHGNNPALEAILDVISRKHVDRIVVAGDIIGGPEPHRTLDIIRNIDGIVIRGNQEKYLIDQIHSPEKFTGTRWALTRAINKRISDEHIEYIVSLPESALFKHESHRVTIVHSTQDASNEVFFPAQDETRTRELLGLSEGNVFICGHSHRQWVLEHRGITGVNPGSAGIPLTTDLAAQYAIVELDGKSIDVQLGSVEYDRDRFIQIFGNSDFFTEIGPIGKAAYFTFLTGKGIMLDFIIHAREVAASLRVEDLTDGVLRHADDTFVWPENKEIL